MEGCDIVYLSIIYFTYLYTYLTYLQNDVLFSVITLKYVLLTRSGPSVLLLAFKCVTENNNVHS